MSKFAPTTVEEAAQFGYTERFDFNFQDIPAGIPAATSQVFLLPKVKAGDEVVEIFVELVTPFQQIGVPANNSTTLDVGDDVSPTQYAAGIIINANAAFVSFTHRADQNNIYTAPHQLQIRLNNVTAGQSLSSLNAGQLIIWYNLTRWADKPKILATPFGSGYT
jgi:hypothetical protein